MLLPGLTLLELVSASLAFFEGVDGALLPLLLLPLFAADRGDKSREVLLEATDGATEAGELPSEADPRDIVVTVAKFKRGGGVKNARWFILIIKFNIL